MAAKVPEPVLPVPRGADPLQLGDGAAAAGEAALRLQVSILSCHHDTIMALYHGTITSLRTQGQVLPQRRRQVRARQGPEVVQLVRSQHHSEVQIRDGAYVNINRTYLALNFIR